MKKKKPLPPGFVFVSTNCRIKGTGKDDLGLILSQYPAVAAAAYTTNRVKAAPLLVTREHLRNSRARAIITNSGNANACTGIKGLADARQTAALVGAAFGLAPQNVVVASTGVIGHLLPMDKIEKGIRQLAAKKGSRSLLPVAKAIMTTDTFPKTASRTCIIGNKKVTLAGMAKGSGMIAPNMATMLSYIITDAAINGPLLRKALRASITQSYNMVTVDGDTSTNDMVACMANHQAGNPLIKKPGKHFSQFQQALDAVTLDLAKMIARDGEGATKLVEVKVINAKNRIQADTVAKAIANSNLVKTAIFGRDPNWGRIICAAGYSGVPIIPEKCALHLNRMKLFDKGLPVKYNKKQAIKKLGGDTVYILLNLNMGKAIGLAYTCDFSYDYVRINAEYTT